MRALRRSRLRLQELRIRISRNSRMCWVAPHHFGGGFAMVYGKDSKLLAGFQAPPESSRAVLLPWLDQGEAGAAVPLFGPLSANLLTLAQRRDEPMINVSGRNTRWAFRQPRRARWWWWRCPCPRGSARRWCAFARAQPIIGSFSVRAIRFAPSSSCCCC
jgi:hypothetical protein